MRRATKLFHALTAGEVMNRAVVMLHSKMSAPQAARLLLERQASAAPVVDALGRCVGVLSATGLLRYAAEECADRKDGARAAGVWCDWQVVDARPDSQHEVGRYLTPDPLQVTADTPVGKIADALLDDGRPVVVVDHGRHPIGMISASGLLAALTVIDGQAHVASPAPRARKDWSHASMHALNA